MKSMTLIQLLALPTTLAFVQLDIILKGDVYGVKVAAKGEESEFLVTDAETYKGEGVRCLNSSHGWTTDCPDDQPQHKQIGQSYFTDIPKDPQPFTLAVDQPSDNREKGMQSVSYKLSCDLY
jgi:hypothetical protein